jgi:integrase
MSGRKKNGEGTISGPRKDGRYVGAFYAPTSAGTVKRVYVYGRTYDEARQNLVSEQSKVMSGIPVPAKSWKLGPHLDYWLEDSIRLVHVLRQVLSAALSRAVREELVSRNVARLVELPSWEPAEVIPWSPDEAMSFLSAAAGDPLLPAFVLLLLYGMRRGEVLGLRWAISRTTRSTSASRCSDFGVSWSSGRLRRGQAIGISRSWAWPTRR